MKAIAEDESLRLELLLDLYAVYVLIGAVQLGNSLRVGIAWE